MPATRLTGSKYCQTISAWACVVVRLSALHMAVVSTYETSSRLSQATGAPQMPNHRGPRLTASRCGEGCVFPGSVCVSFTMASPEIGVKIKGAEHRQPHHINKVPIDCAYRYRRVTLGIEMAQRGPDEYHRQHQHAAQHMQHMETGDSEIQRAIGVIGDREGFCMPFLHLYGHERYPQNQCQTNRLEQPQPLSPAHSAFAPP